MNNTNIRSWHVAGKKVFVRIDGNVPIENGIIQNDFRLQAILPTLAVLRDGGAHITIATHVGRPQGKDPALSTKPLKQWFIEHGYGAANVLENLRFNPGEKNNDLMFAKELAQGMDFYVNDAWGLLHRHDASITRMPTLFQQDKRAFGLLVHKELQMLSTLKNSPEQPYVVVLGGGKPESKIVALQHLIAAQKPAAIIILPAITAPFAKALGLPFGKSLITHEPLSAATAIIKYAAAHNIKLLLPIDYTYMNSWEGDLNTCDADKLTTNVITIGIGPKSIQLFKPDLMQAATIFFNGAMGIPSRPETMKPLHAILRIIAESPAYSVVGGGNSVTEVVNLKLLSAIDYCSTGGGSTLAYISGGSMPGLEAM